MQEHPGELPTALAMYQKVLKDPGLKTAEAEMARRKLAEAKALFAERPAAGGTVKWHCEPEPVSPATAPCGPT